MDQEILRKMRERFKDHPVMSKIIDGYEFKSDQPKSHDIKPNARTTECIHLGVRVKLEESPDKLRNWRYCDKGHGVVCPCGKCKTCPDYEPDGESE